MTDASNTQERTDKTGTKVTEETFRAWQEERKHKRQRAKSGQESRAEGIGHEDDDDVPLSGRDLFEHKRDLFVDDDDGDAAKVIATTTITTLNSGQPQQESRQQEQSTKQQQQQQQQEDQVEKVESEVQRNPSFHNDDLDDLDED